MIKRLLLTFLMNGIFAWSLYLLGWNHPDIWAFLLVIPLVLSVSLTLSAGHWALWNQGTYGRNRIALNICFNIVFAWLCYFYGWYDLRTFPTFGNGLEMIAWLAIIGVLVHWAIGNLQIRQTTEIEKQKRERIDSILRDLSDEDLLRLRRRLLDGTINDELLEAQMLGDDGELVKR